MSARQGAGGNTVSSKNLRPNHNLNAVSSTELRSAWLGAAGASVVVAALAADNGGYFPTSWGWSAILFGWVGALAAASAPRIPVSECIFVGTLSGLGLWTWLSLEWSQSHAASPLESLRVLTLALAVAAVVLAVSRSDVLLLGGALLASIAGISIYALATRLFPDRIGIFDSVAGYRLSTPIGYWNSLGLFAALGLLLAIGFVARASTAAAAIAAATAPVQAATIYFTFSRGAWICLAVAVVFAVIIDPRRLQLLVAVIATTPLPALGIWLSSRSASLTHQQAAVAQAAHDGHRIALAITMLAAGNAVLAVGLRVIEPRVVIEPKYRRALNALLMVAALVAVVGGLAAAGGPIRLAERADHAFTAPPPVTSENLNRRLFSFSGSWRSTLWRVAWSDVTEHSLLGSGAGSYEQYWLQHRTTSLKVRDAHSLYLETLAELGPIGLLLLVVALAIPLTALPRARHHPLVPALAGAYVAFLVHAAVDWDWEVLAVTLTALFCGAGILIAARTGEEKPLSQRWRVGMIAAILVVMAVAFVGLVGNIEISRANGFAGKGQWAKAEAAARKAHSWAPWSSQPLQALGEAQLGAGDLAAAQASFQRAIAKSPKDWNLWFDLARASAGRAQARALGQAHRLNPLSPEVAEFEQELAAQGQITVAK